MTEYQDRWYHHLGKIGGFLGGLAALGGLLIAVYNIISTDSTDKTDSNEIPSVKIEVVTESVNGNYRKNISNTIVGRWLVNILDSTTQVDSVWIEKRSSTSRFNYDPSLVDGVIKVEHSDRSDELNIGIWIKNESFDHRFVSIVKVAQDSFWLLGTKHMKQYGAEPNLIVESGELYLTEAGRLRLDLRIKDYASFIMFADRP